MVHFEEAGIGLSRIQILAERYQCQSVHQGSQVVVGFYKRFSVVHLLVLCVIGALPGIRRK